MDSPSLTTNKQMEHKTKFIAREAVVTFTPSKVKQSEMPKVSRSEDAYEVVRNFYADVMNYQEQFSVILLNRQNKVLGVKVISQGGLSATVADPKLIFNAAIASLATAIILVHNHPSGNLNPSDADKELTKKLRAGGTLLEINVLDHLIVTEDGFYSFADNEC